MSWQRLGGAYGLRIQLRNGSLFRFGGFQNDDKEKGKLKEFFKEFYRLDLKTKELSLTGRNWGTANFDSASLSFDIDKQTAFEVSFLIMSEDDSLNTELSSV